MRIIKESDRAQLAVDILEGQTVVLPTETSYGLGCDATSQAAVDQIFKIKGRDFKKSLLIVVPSVAAAKKYLQWNDVLEKIANQYWPGPVTVVGDYAGGTLARGVVAQDNTVAVRVTAHPLLKSLTEKLGRPLVATSANLASAGEVYSAKELVKIFKNRKLQPDIILDAGELPRRKPTTIVSVLGGQLKILRQGEVKVYEDAQHDI